MSTIQMEIPHPLSQQEAQDRIQSVLKNVEARFAGQVKDLRQDWNGNMGTFSFSVMGMAVSGTLEVQEGKVSLDSKLPMAAAMFSGKIREVILEEAKKVLG